jgi:hypothetical protein
MRSSTKKDTKKSPGRPATGIGIQIGTRWPPDIVRLVDEWRRVQDDLPNRPEAIRRLVELGLTVRTRSKQSKPARAERAKELAGKVIDSFSTDGADVEETASRKRRLLKGPEEFREVRVDRLKVKTK